MNKRYTVRNSERNKEQADKVSVKQRQRQRIRSERSGSDHDILNTEQRKNFYDTMVAINAF